MDKNVNKTLKNNGKHHINEHMKSTQTLKYIHCGDGCRKQVIGVNGENLP